MRRERKKKLKGDFLSFAPFIFEGKKSELNCFSMRIGPFLIYKTIFCYFSFELHLAMNYSVFLMYFLKSFMVLHQGDTEKHIAIISCVNADNDYFLHGSLNKLTRKKYTVIRVHAGTFH